VQRQRLQGLRVWGLGFGVWGLDFKETQTCAASEENRPKFESEKEMEGEGEGTIGRRIRQALRQALQGSSQDRWRPVQDLPWESL